MAFGSHSYRRPADRRPAGATRGLPSPVRPVGPVVVQIACVRCGRIQERDETAILELGLNHAFSCRGGCRAA